MIVTQPTPFVDGDPLKGSQVCKDIFHTGHNPDVTAGKGAGEVLQGRLELVNLQPDVPNMLPRAAVRRRAFHSIPRVSSVALNMDFTQELFNGVVVNLPGTDTRFLDVVVPIPGAVATWENRFPMVALEVRIGLVIAAGTDDSDPDFTDPAVPTSGYANVSGDWMTAVWVGMFLGSGDEAVFLDNYDSFFPLGQTQTRNSLSTSGTKQTTTVKDYTDVRTWTDRLIIDQAWLLTHVAGISAANNPLLTGSKTIGLRIAHQVQLARVKRAYISVLPMR